MNATTIRNPLGGRIGGPLRERLSGFRFPWHLIFVTLFVWLHTGVLTTLAAASVEMLTVVAFLPTVVTLALRAQSRRTWWRWPILWFLFFSAVGASGLVILLCGEGWILYHAWKPVPTERPSKQDKTSRPSTPHRPRKSKKRRK